MGPRMSRSAQRLLSMAVMAWWGAANAQPQLVSDAPPIIVQQPGPAGGAAPPPSNNSLLQLLSPPQGSLTTNTNMRPQITLQPPPPPPPAAQPAQPQTTGTPVYPFSTTSNPYQITSEFAIEYDHSANTFQATLHINSTKDGVIPAIYLLQLQFPEGTHRLESVDPTFRFEAVQTFPGWYSFQPTRVLEGRTLTITIQKGTFQATADGKAPAVPTRVLLSILKPPLTSIQNLPPGVPPTDRAFFTLRVTAVDLVSPQDPASAGREPIGEGGSPATVSVGGVGNSTTPADAAPPVEPPSSDPNQQPPNLDPFPEDATAAPTAPPLSAATIGAITGGVACIAVIVVGIGMLARRRGRRYFRDAEDVTSPLSPAPNPSYAL